jgi:hypothetical protein
MVVALFNRGVGRLCPPMIAFLGLDAGGAHLCRHPAARLFLFLVALAVLHVVVICVATTLAVQYRVPFDPILIILGVAGFIRHGFGGRPATLASQ